MNPHDIPNGGRDRTVELLSQALREEAAMVHTDPSALHEIQERTRTSGSARRSWVYAGVGAAAATAAVIAGVAILGDRSDHKGAQPAGGGTNGTVEQAPSVDVTLTYLGDARNGHRLVTENRSVQPVPGGDTAIAAVHDLLTGTPDDSDYSSGWPEGIDVGGIATSNQVIQVDLTGPAGRLDQGDPSYSAKAQSLAVQALFRTAGGRVGDTGRLTYNGDPVSSVFGVALPVTIRSDDVVRALVQVVNLADGQTVDNPVTVTVSANPFEGTVNWQLVQAGNTVNEGFVTAPGGMGQWSQAPIDLGTLAAGTYTIRCFEYSPKDGSIVNLDDKTFAVS